jgi:hypothetical protein
MALDVEGVLDRAVNGKKALRWSGRFETLNLPLAPTNERALSCLDDAR